MMNQFHHRYFPNSLQNEDIQENVTRSWEGFLQMISTPQGGGPFLVVEESSHYDRCIELYERFRHKREFIHVGIGGSHLGAAMLVEALGRRNNGVQFTFINNVDPDLLYAQLLNLRPEDCLFYVVSKSGGTAETLAAWTVIVEWFKEKGISPSELHQFMVFATDPEKGDLRKIGKNFGIDMLPIPTHVGGRYSVLTSVGLFPALFAGVDIKSLLEGAKDWKKNLLSSEAEENEILKLTSFLLYLKKEGIDETVIMPYSALLSNFSLWFVQLWAESLGKKFDRSGQIVHEGLTPIAALGAVDQHSQLQLFVEGPLNKCIVFIEIEKFRYDFNLDNTWSDFSSLKKLAPLKLSELFKAELEGTMAALVEASRPHLCITLPSLNERSLGALILSFEFLTAFTGYCLNIDPFDQPGVETSKIYAFQWAYRLKGLEKL